MERSTCVYAVYKTQKHKSFKANFDNIISNYRNVKVDLFYFISFTRARNLCESDIVRLRQLFDGSGQPTTKANRKNDKFTCGIMLGMDTPIIVELTRTLKGHVFD